MSHLHGATALPWPARGVLALIRLYQLTLSPYIGRQCRFYPTCSRYAMEAIETHGLLRGAALSARRLGRCHPFHPGGVDPVPGRDDVTVGAGVPAATPLLTRHNATHEES